MKRKINRYLIWAVLLTMVATLVTTVMIFHHMYRKQVIQDLRLQAKLLCCAFATGEELGEHITNPPEEMRITVICSDGEVIYDSQAELKTMENHGNRSEIQEAEQNGEGYAVRESDTLGRAMYYYAYRMEDGSVLRISKEENSIWSLFNYTMYGVILVGVLMLLLCMVFSRYLTNSLIRPIERMAEDLERAAEQNPYEELAPFVQTIQSQHRDILKNAGMRQEFTANVSHELKTPLTSISGYAELIATGLAGEGESRRFAGIIHQNADRLLTLINDIIRLSELDSGHSDLVFEELDLYELAEKSVNLLAMSAEKHDVTLKLEGKPAVMCGNKEMIEELLYNLCDNAIRYNKPGGSVLVTVYPECLPDGDGAAVVSVKDTGIGIPQESRSRIFERFYRVDKSRSKATGGTGLGLAIVKHIVMQHDAGIEVESEEGKGTVMRVIFKTSGG